MKQTFKIPEGCSKVTIEQIGNQLITSFESEKYIPKVGDCLKLNHNNEIILIECSNLYFKNRPCGFETIINNFKVISSNCTHTAWQSHWSIEKITPSQFQSEFEKLGYVYDFETHTASKKRWRAEKEDEYFYISDDFEIESDLEAFLGIDNLRYEMSNYFQTKEQAEKAAEFLKQQLKKYLIK